MVKFGCLIRVIIHGVFCKVVFIQGAARGNGEVTSHLKAACVYKLIYHAPIFSFLGT